MCVSVDVFSTYMYMYMYFTAHCTLVSSSNQRAPRDKGNIMDGVTVYVFGRDEKFKVHVMMNLMLVTCS